MSTIKFILAVLLTVILSLNYLGFCYSQKRFLSDEEKLNIVVKEILASEAERFKYYKRVISLDKNNERRMQLEKEYPGEPVPYRDINEFFFLNPGCCAVGTELTFEGAISHLSHWNRLVNTISLVVTIKYLKRYRDNEGVIQTKPVKHDWLITNCGNIWDYSDLWTYFE